MGVAVQRRHPERFPRAVVRAHVMYAWAREQARSVSVLNLGIQGVKGQGPSPTDPVIGGDSRYGAKKKGLASARPLNVGDSVMAYREFSPLICRAWQYTRGSESWTKACFVTVFQRALVRGSADLRAASEQMVMDNMAEGNLPRHVTRRKRRQDF
jgi:hypothetical protein